MKHYGDITKLSGYDLPVVDCITGGSPCQDLSVAGAQKGLAGERSGLFMEQIRIVKEMRERDRQSGRTGHYIRPRYMVWENVPGAFSSNGGGDFQTVLTEITRVAEPEAPDVPVPEKARWSKAGCLYDELGRWSIAWRVHDAQFWGVPQRRKRIALVADFGGLTAPEVLFERQGLSGDFEPGGEARQGTAANSAERLDTAIALQGNGIDRADTAGCNGRGWRYGGAYSLNTIDRHAVAVFGIDQQGGKGSAAYTENIAPTMASDSHGTPHAVCQPVVYDARGNGDGETVPTITGDHGNRVTDYTGLVCLNDQGGRMNTSVNVTGTLRAQMGGHPPVIIDRRQPDEDIEDI